MDLFWTNTKRSLYLSRRQHGWKPSFPILSSPEKCNLMCGNTLGSKINNDNKRRYCPAETARGKCVPHLVILGKQLVAFSTVSERSGADCSLLQFLTIALIWPQPMTDGSNQLQFILFHRKQCCHLMSIFIRLSRMWKCFSSKSHHCACAATIY